MNQINLNSARLRDQILGCWMGKNCGGTLGTPLEKAWGEAEVFDVWWYPVLADGGIPNDDLEMQLVWLRALEEVGPQLKAADLARTWQNHIAYNMDEFGLSKTGLSLGLRPPISSYYNNWFRDCMGCPIRSEIWACVAPGAPRVAVRLAFEDGIVDHAGGESIYGEFFNTAVESAAFCVSDVDKLLDIGLSYIPETCLTARAIRVARDCHAQGLTWQEARQKVLETAPHYNAQFSPPNIAFQVVGWLWGLEFGDAICKAVNCGYDTDCTGATLGSVLGIIGGAESLPEKWTEPLGHTIATSAPSGGLTHVEEIPQTLDELTERVLVQARRVLSFHGLLNGDDTVKTSETELWADDTVRALWHKNPTSVEFSHLSDAVHVALDYIDTPAMAPNGQKTVQVALSNPQPKALQVAVSAIAPAGWSAKLAQNSVEIPAGGAAKIDLHLESPARAQLENAQTIFVAAAARNRPVQSAAPFVMVGARAVRLCGPFPLDGKEVSEVMEAETELEHPSGDAMSPQARKGEWREVVALDNALPVEGELASGGVLYAQLWLHSDEEVKDGWIATGTTCAAKIWVNGETIATSLAARPLRPNYDGPYDGTAAPYGDAHLRAGWNEVLIKYVRAEDAELPFEAHFIVCHGARHTGLTTARWTRFPWDKASKPSE
ncbi:MAG: ADP-ribosylglycohydrolase family protein [Armatimonadetes bacterium]|nr:ADP-ribosylglycohydrolase family protein [Armatimonadota bacterium]